MYIFSVVHVKTSKRSLSWYGASEANNMNVINLLFFKDAAQTGVCIHNVNQNCYMIHCCIYNTVGRVCCIDNGVRRVCCITME